jgi:tRNA pseudouridine38-40 synthase
MVIKLLPLTPCFWVEIMRVAVKFAYDGRKFNGYARQPGLKTVEGEIITTLLEKGFIEDVKDSCFRSASRTDKNASALGNVFAFNTEYSEENVLRGLKNSLKNILVYGVRHVEPSFYPRHAKHRIYRYYLRKNDFEKTLQAASLFTGKHDFSNFAKLEEFKNPVRTIDNITITPTDNFLVIDFYAQTFLWNQIRRIVSAMEKIRKGLIEKKQIIDALQNPDEKVDFGLAPAEPLILKDIIYNFEFKYIENFSKRLDDFEKKIVSTL